MESEHFTAKKVLQDMRKAEFEAFINGFLFSKIEKSILYDIYINRLPLWEVGNRHGYSESGVKKIHCKLLKKIIKGL